MDDLVTQTKPPQPTQVLQDVAESAPGTPSEPSHEDIARRAYDIYVSKNCRKGQCQANWHQAEHELREPTVTTGPCDVTEAAGLDRMVSEPSGNTVAHAFSSIMDVGGTACGGSPTRLQGGCAARV